MPSTLVRLMRSSRQPVLDARAYADRKASAEPNDAANSINLRLDIDMWNRS